MSRAALLVGLLVAAGCQGTPRTSFWPPLLATTVPPPGTSARSQPNGYYTPAAAATAPLAAPPALAAAAAPPNLAAAAAQPPRLDAPPDTLSPYWNQAAADNRSTRTDDSGLTWQTPRPAPAPPSGISVATSPTGAASSAAGVPARASISRDTLSSPATGAVPIGSGWSGVAASSSASTEPAIRIVESPAGSSLARSATTGATATGASSANNAFTAPARSPAPASPAANSGLLEISRLPRPAAPPPAPGFRSSAPPPAAWPQFSAADLAPAAAALNSLADAWRPRGP